MSSYCSKEKERELKWESEPEWAGMSESWQWQSEPEWVRLSKSELEWARESVAHKYIEKSNICVASWSYSLSSPA